MKILIVEDEVFAAMHLEAALEDLGCTVIGIAPDSQSALELGAMAPDLAVVDLNLRDGPTGPIVARELANRYGTKVLFLTANPSETGEMFDNVVGVVIKPWDERIMAQALHDAGHSPPSSDQSAA
jgi:two-component system, response regulator PdtaR